MNHVTIIRTFGKISALMKICKLKIVYIKITWTETHFEHKKHFSLARVSIVQR